MRNAVLIGAGLTKNIVGFPVFGELLQCVEEQSDKSLEQKQIIEIIAEYRSDGYRYEVFDTFLVRRLNAISRNSIVSAYMEIINNIFVEKLYGCPPNIVLDENSNTLLSLLTIPDLVIITTNYDPLLNLSVWIRIYEETRSMLLNSNSDLNLTAIAESISSIEKQILGTPNELFNLPDKVKTLIDNHLGGLSDEFYEKYLQISRPKGSDNFTFENFFKIDNMQNRIFYLHGHCFKNQNMYKVVGIYATAENELDDGPSELIGETNRGRVYRKFNAQFRDTTFDKLWIVGMSALVAGHVLLDKLECSAKKVLMGFHCDDEIESYENLKTKLLSIQRFRTVELLQTAHLIDEISIR